MNHTKNGAPDILNNINKLCIEIQIQMKIKHK